jgi:hypothetical protein
MNWADFGPDNSADRQSRPAKAHIKRKLSGPILRRDIAPFYTAIDIRLGETRAPKREK